MVEFFFYLLVALFDSLEVVADFFEDGVLPYERGVNDHRAFRAQKPSRGVLAGVVFLLEQVGLHTLGAYGVVVGTDYHRYVEGRVVVLVTDLALVEEVLLYCGDLSGQGVGVLHYGVSVRAGRIGFALMLYYW